MRTPACNVCGVVAEMRQIHTIRDPARPLSQGESTPTLPLTGFYCFFITLRMILIYYAQIRFRWLPFTENKGCCIKKEGYLQM